MKLSILSSLALPGKYCRFSQKMPFSGSKLTVLEAKRVKIGLQKQLWQPEEQTFFDRVFLFLWQKDQAKTCKIEILTSHALPEK